MNHYEIETMNRMLKDSNATTLYYLRKPPYHARDDTRAILVLDMEDERQVDIFNSLLTLIEVKEKEDYEEQRKTRGW